MELILKKRLLKEWVGNPSPKKYTHIKENGYSFK